MATYQYPTYDSLLQQMITDYSNLVPAPDTAVGSPVWIQCSVIAQAIWGLYVYQSNGLQMAFPDSATGNFLDRWGSVFGIPRMNGELDTAYSTRMCGILQQPPAGGNAQDYINWALIACGVSNPTPANLPETFLPAQVNTSAGTPASAIILGGITNPVGWVTGDPITFTSTGSLPGGLTTGTYYSGIRSYDGQYYFNIFTDSGLTNEVTITSKGTGIHKVQHASQGPTDPNSFYVVDAQICTPNSTSNASPPGSVYIWLEPNNESILSVSNVYFPATYTLQTLVTNYINTRRPITANRNTVFCETIDTYNMQITVSPVTTNIGLISSDIENYMSNLVVGERLYGAQLLSVCLVDGATTATFNYIAGPDGTFSTTGGFDGTYFQPVVGHVTRLGTLTITPENI